MNMNKKIMTLKGYANRFREFRTAVQDGIQAVEGTLQKFEKDFGDTSIVKKNGFSVEFNSIGFRIKLKFMKNLSKRIGYLQWYHIGFNEDDQKYQGKLILEHYFDELGKIFEDKARERAFYAFRSGFEDYFYRTLLTFFQTLEKETCTGF